MTELPKEVKTLIEEAERQEEAINALQFSQAALNVANAIRCMADMPDK